MLVPVPGMCPPTGFVMQGLRKPGLSEACCWSLMPLKSTLDDHVLAHLLSFLPKLLRHAFCLNCLFIGCPTLSNTQLCRRYRFSRTALCGVIARGWSCCLAGSLATCLAGYQFIVGGQPVVR